MEMPQVLRDAIEAQTNGNHAKLMLDAESLSLRYRTHDADGKRLLTQTTEVLAYAAARMPATFGAVSSALAHALAQLPCKPSTLLDVGAGTGAATWAADAQLELASVTCLEREDAMRHVGAALMQSSPKLAHTEWVAYDLTSAPVPTRADLVIASYVLNEMTHGARLQAIETLWEATDMMLLLVEPGTPTGFSNLRAARQMLLERGAHIAAPCTHEDICETDWCHFTCRVPRSRLHRQLKRGDAPYEDEKFMYMAFTRKKSTCASTRVLRHPQLYSGYATFEVCTKDGLRNITLSKKDGELYKLARKAKSGDALE